MALLVLGALLMLGALVSGLERRGFVSLTSLFVLIGFVLGPGVTGALRFDARSSFVSELATVALVVILFRDGLEVEGEMLQAHWRLPLRKLVLAMPLTAVLVALTARVVTGLSWTESFLLGALLSPTDPVLSSSVVTNPRVPRLIRHSLNLESGMNDGLALPAVLAFAAALSTNGGHFVWWRFVLEDLTIGLATGLVVGLIAARLMPRSHSLAEGIPRHQKSLYALGTAFAAYGIAVLPPRGNGLIAVFVAAITLGIRRPDLAPVLRRPGRKPGGDRQARDLCRVRLASHPPRALRRRLAGAGGGGDHAAPGAAGGGVHRADRDRHRRGHQGLHVLVRTQGGGHDDLLAPGAGRPDRRRRPDLQPCRPGRVLLDHPPRPE